jgi:4-hydroxy-2-oxoheptanedioate aldolase
MRTNTTKARLATGEAVFGCFVRYADATLVEVLAYQGWDFLVFDGEHGAVEPRDCEQMVRAAELRNVTPIARVPTNSPPSILRYLDTGAQGVHVPWVNSGAEAEAAVRAVKYQPRGMRGLASVRAAEYGQTMPFGQYVQRANAETMVVIHIETADAVARLPELLEVPDIDVIFIGPTDLSHSLGVPGQTQHPAVQAAMQQVVDAVTGSRAALGILVTSAAEAQAWRARGARYLVTSFEAIAAPAFRAYLTAARA